MKLKSLSRIRTDRKCGETTTRGTKCNHQSRYMLTFVELSSRMDKYLCRQHAQVIALREAPGLLHEIEELRKENDQLKLKIEDLEEKIFYLNIKYLNCLGGDR